MVATRTGEVEIMFDAMIDRLAFAYVTGSLKGFRRVMFSGICKLSSSAREHLAFWEEQLLPLNVTTPPRATPLAVWSSIEQGIAKPQVPLSNFWQPVLVGVCTSVLLLLAISPTLMKPSAASWDYVAVMHSPDNELSLIAKSRKQDLLLELQWQMTKPTETVELWAESKTDGQIRSIALISDATNIMLSEANWRLIKDAHRLIATIEEQGGSPTGEPSAQWLASGLCARLDRG